MARKYPTCPKCPHAIDSHQTEYDEYASVRGCLHCECMEYRPSPPPPPSVPLTDDNVRYLSNLARKIHKGIAAAELELAELRRPGSGFGDQIRAGYSAAVDLVAVLGVVLRDREFPKMPPETSMLGIEPAKFDQELVNWAYGHGWKPPVGHRLR